MLYNTTVLPLFDYCSSIWDSCGVGSKAYLDKLNRRATCIIEGRSFAQLAQPTSTQGISKVHLSL